MFVTDNVLTTLMCAPRTVYSWDLVITKADGKLWIDRRDAAGTNPFIKSIARVKSFKVNSGISNLLAGTQHLLLNDKQASVPDPGLHGEKYRYA